MYWMSRKSKNSPLIIEGTTYAYIWWAKFRGKEKSNGKALRSLFKVTDKQQEKEDREEESEEEGVWKHRGWYQKTSYG